MRCFIALTLMAGSPGGEAPGKIYVNRDLVSVVTPVRLDAGSAYAGARSLLSFNGNSLRWVRETPDEVMKAACVNGRDTPAPD